MVLQQKAEIVTASTGRQEQAKNRDDIEEDHEKED